jgi:hypothetical protein
VAFGFVGIIAFIASVVWRRSDVKAQGLAQAENAELRQRYSVIDELFQEMANKRAEQIANNHEIPWEDFKQTISDKTDDALDAKLASFTLDDLLAIDEESDEWGEIITEGNRAVDSACKNEGLSSGLAEVGTVLATWVKAEYLTPDGARAICNAALRPEINARVRDLTNNGNGDSYVAEAAWARLLKRRAELMQDRVDLLTQQATALENTVEQTGEELDGKREALRKNQTELENKDIEPERKEELEEENTTLQEDIDRLEGDYKRQNGDLQDKIEERRRRDKKRKQDEREKNDRERNADHSLSDGLAGE